MYQTSFKDQATNTVISIDNIAFSHGYSTEAERKVICEEQVESHLSSQDKVMKEYEDKLRD